MKKTVSLFLILCTCLSLSAILTSCDLHQHAFSTDWSSDETCHWHACYDASCAEVADKAEHDWDNGKKEKDPVTGKKGPKIYTCTVCGATTDKNPHKNKGLDKDEWAAMLDPENFENYTLTEIQRGIVAGKETLTENVYKVADGKTFVHTKVNGTPVTSLLHKGQEALKQKDSFEKIYRSLLADFDNYAYDEAENAYKTTAPISADIALDNALTTTFTLENAKLVLTDDGKILSLEGNASMTTEIPFLGKQTSTFSIRWTFSDYGTTVVEDAAE